MAAAAAAAVVVAASGRVKGQNLFVIDVERY